MTYIITCLCLIVPKKSLKRKLLDAKNIFLCLNKTCVKVLRILSSGDYQILLSGDYQIGPT